MAIVVEVVEVSVSEEVKQNRAKMSLRTRTRKKIEEAGERTA